MRQFKIRKGREYPTLEVSADNFYNALPSDLEEREKNFAETAQGRKPIAICPSCENPIRLFGLAKPIERTMATGKKVLVHPYGKHLELNTEIAVYDENKYKYCPLASGYRMSIQQLTYGTLELFLTAYCINIYLSKTMLSLSRY